MPVAAGDHHRTAQVRFGHRTQYEGEQDGRERIVVTLHEVADDAETDGQIDVEHVLAHGVGADQRQNEDDRNQYLLLDADDLGEEANPEGANGKHGDVGHDHRGKYVVDDVQMLLVEHRSGLQALNDEGTKQYSGDGVSGDAE